VSHLDPDRLVLIALGEQTPGPVEADHLQDCAACRDELAATREVADLGRHTEELRELPVPSEALWQRIAAQAFAPGTAGVALAYPRRYGRPGRELPRFPADPAGRPVAGPGGGTGGGTGDCGWPRWPLPRWYWASRGRSWSPAWQPETPPA